MAVASWPQMLYQARVGAVVVDTQPPFLMLAVALAAPGMCA
jgi:hypothetical protein